MTIVKAEKGIENKTTESDTWDSSRQGPNIFDGSTHWTTYHRQFEVAACTNNWTEEEQAVYSFLL